MKNKIINAANMSVKELYVDLYSNKVIEIAENNFISGCEFMQYEVKQAITTCLKPSGFDLQQFKEILGIE
jgi:hypothetical protein